MMRPEQRDDHSLTRAGEDYLEAIYVLSLDVPDGAVRSVDVADDLKVSKASVNKALSMLKDEGMVNQEHYGKVTLTDEGRAYARLVWRAHRALRAFLIDEIGVDEETADEEACLMEHALSAKTMDLLVGHLKEKGIFIED
jgi:Mn-dependent DtxR family transcriptional regulator